VLVLDDFRTKAGERVGVTRPGAGLLLVCASFATDRVIRRRSIRMIYAGPPVSRRVLHNRGLTVVTVPADTACTAQQDCRRGQRFRYADARDGEALASPPGRNRGALAPGLMRIG
jgi:hypothetical protein